MLSSCPTMATPDTELVPAADVLCAFGVTEVRDAYRGYLDACLELGVDGAERSRASKTTSPRFSR